MRAPRRPRPDERDEVGEETPLGPPPREVALFLQLDGAAHGKS
jgi:hypothetical protein